MTLHSMSSRITAALWPFAERPLRVDMLYIGTGS
jgi:hypothetical protein